MICCIILVIIFTDEWHVNLFYAKFDYNFFLLNVTILYNNIFTVWTILLEATLNLIILYMYILDIGYIMFIIN